MLAWWLDNDSIEMIEIVSFQSILKPYGSYNGWLEVFLYLNQEFWSIIATFKYALMSLIIHSLIIISCPMHAFLVTI